MNETVNSPAKYLLAQYDLHHRLFNNVLSGFTDEETNTRVNGNGNMNHVKYLAGHILNAQYGFSGIGGIKAGVKWNELFATRNQSAAKDGYPYPGIDEILAEWNSLHKPAREALSGLTEEKLNSEPPFFPFKFPPFENTLGGFWTFLNHHQAYHIGQIGLLRRGFGKEPMSYAEMNNNK